MKGIERFGLPKPGATPAAQAVAADGWLFVAGQVPRDANGHVVYGDITVQARQALDNLVSRLSMAGYTTKDVVRVTVYLDDTRDFAAFNAVYREYFSAEDAPARVCVQAHMVVDIKVEIDCIAWKAAQ